MQDDWSKFRRALRQEDQQAFDELFALAKFHTAPMAYASTPAPMEAVLLSMLIELMKRVRGLEAESKGQGSGVRGSW